MITVANLTHTAARVQYAFEHKRIRIEELCDPDKILHIDSKVLDEAEAQEEPAEVLVEADAVDETDEEAAARTRRKKTVHAPKKKLTKKERAELLRKTVDTIGREGQPGEQIQNVISVGMLSEGWDAKTVTHIMGLRAFTSQLLCEQVVGRGLRRTSYEVNETTGLFRAGVRQHFWRAVHVSSSRRQRRCSAPTAGHRQDQNRAVCPSDGRSTR